MENVLLLYIKTSCHWSFVLMDQVNNIQLYLSRFIRSEVSSITLGLGGERGREGGGEGEEKRGR